MSNIVNDLQSALTPPPPPPLPTEVARENIRVLVQMLGFPVADVREVSITPSRVLVQTVARDDQGAVVMVDGLATYRVAELAIVEPDGSTVA